MGNFLETLYSPMAVTGVNIDPRYFKDNEDGTYTPTPLLIHNIARDAAKYFKSRLLDLDENNLYHSESVREVKDTWAEKLHNDEWNVKYGEKIAEANKRWYKYRNEHPDEFEVRFKRIAIGGEDESRFFAGYSPDVTVGLTESVKLYNAASDFMERFAGPDKEGNTGSEYNTLPMDEPLYSKVDFAEAHKGVRAKISEELGIPNDDFEVGKIEKIVTRINNKKCKAVGSDDEALAGFTEGLIKYITSSTALEFKAKRAEMITLIDKDFIVNFNDTVKDLKAEAGDHDSIYVYTKCTESTSPVKIITIMKEEPTDPNYKYYFSIVTDSETLRYNKMIATKADLRKALETTIIMIEDIDEFKKYVADIQRTIDSL